LNPILRLQKIILTFRGMFILLLLWVLLKFFSLPWLIWSLILFFNVAIYKYVLRVTGQNFIIHSRWYIHTIILSTRTEGNAINDRGKIRGKYQLSFKIMVLLVKEWCIWREVSVDLPISTQRIREAFHAQIVRASYKPPP